MNDKQNHLINSSTISRKPRPVLASFSPLSAQRVIYHKNHDYRQGLGKNQRCVERDHFEGNWGKEDKVILQPEAGSKDNKGRNSLDILLAWRKGLENFAGIEAA